MRNQMIRTLMLVAAFWLVGALSQSALAGPPLICHPIEIGDAQSLAWTGPNWRDVKRDYDLNRLVEDTLALLTPQTPVLVRMETLRRATVYAVWGRVDREVGIAPKDSKIADDLLARLMERTRETLRKDQSPALALFDAGYLIASYQQSGYRSENNAAAKLDSYGMVRKASQLNNGNLEMEFALALMSQHPARSTHQEHRQKAIAGAKDGSLLARNLAKHFGKPGQSFADLRGNIAATKQ